MTSATAVLTVFIALIPLFTGVLGHFVLPEERLTLARVAGLLLAAPAAAIVSSFAVAAVTWRGWLAAAYNGVIGSSLAFLLIFLMIQRFGVTTAALSTLVQPMAAAVIGAVLLGEIITLPWLWAPP